jgi:hypothetical protein
MRDNAKSAAGMSVRDREIVRIENIAYAGRNFPRRLLPAIKGVLRGSYPEKIITNKRIRGCTPPIKRPTALENKI